MTAEFPTYKRYLVTSCTDGEFPKWTDNLELARKYNDTGEYYVIDLETRMVLFMSEYGQPEDQWHIPETLPEEQSNGNAT